MSLCIGNEAVGRELMLHMILYLVQNYETDYYVRYSYRCTRYTTTRQTTMSATVIGVPGYRTMRQTTMSGTVIGIPGTELRDRLLCQVQL